MCAEPLDDDDQAGAAGLACSNGHRYDRAREGYVNLVPGGRLRGRPAGDDEAMVRARRAVFDAGLYDPIIDAVADAIADTVSARGAQAILDCGCGEGTYLARAVDRAGAAGSSVEGWGIDISKPAVRAASRRFRAHHHAVASSYALPFADGLFGVALSVFSPRPHDEMMRVLAPNGAAIVVEPGPDHLHELKALLYDDARRHREPATPEGREWSAVPTSIDVVRFVVELSDPVSRTALLEMTPFWWSADATRRGIVAERLGAVTADMRLSVFPRPA
ncbi:MAG: rRNA ((745)-N(1))-methyltransferase [Ilumatobacteraceae bacterium]|nr:rRNA ((745)-N(1))-methyltransferase [Ilumatobacteraceae bacterium]